jgi:hypothetical protein
VPQCNNAADHRPVTPQRQEANRYEKHAEGYVRKQFFFEKKNQKTFDYIEPGGAQGRDQSITPLTSS